MSDAKFFARGKVQEFREDLTEDKSKDPKHNKKRSALKRIVANMTMGNDMSALFPDVVACMQIGDMEIKKMVYLFLVNYGRNKPEMILLAVNSFLKDANDGNPLIRALAIRTMAYINVDRITECLCQPLRSCIKDRDPYVRKTAAMAVVKLYFNDKELVKSQGLLDELKGMVQDSNPTVVANALVALMELHEKADDFQFTLDSDTASNLCTALNECSEWAQTYIMESMMFVRPRDSAEAESLADRIVPRMQHANSGVVLSAVKVLLHFINFITSPDYTNTIYKKMAPPLVTLISSEPEIQYVALRNILLVVQKRPDMLKHELKVFFCKYNDPIYVKLAKLDVMFKLVHADNVEVFLSELKEYASEVDVEFVRRAVRCIGRCAIKIESCADKCIDALVELIKTKVNYVVQEGIVVIKDIFRKYPNKYESIIGTLCENLDGLDEPEAKASMIWIIGHYSDRISNSAELLETFIDTFLDEITEVQLALLTATVKLFIKRPNDGKTLVPKILKWATEQMDNPDVRDRGYIYWRLLSTDPVAAKTIVYSERPPISTDTENIESGLLEELLGQLDTLCAVYHKPARIMAAHLKSYRGREQVEQKSRAQTNQGAIQETYNPYANNINQTAVQKNKVGNLLDFDDDADQQDLYQQSGQQVTDVYQNSATASQQQHQPLDILGQLGSLGLAGAQSATGSFAPPRQQLLSAANAKGMEIQGTFARRQGQIVMELVVHNRALQHISDVNMQFNKNSFAVIPGTAVSIRNPLPANQSAETIIPLVTSPGTHLQITNPINQLHVAIKNNVGLFFFQTLLPLHVLLVEDGLMPQQDFLRVWKEEVGSSTTQSIDQFKLSGIEGLRIKLSANNIFIVAERIVEQKAMLYCSCRLVNDCYVLMELQCASAGPIQACVVSVRSTSVAVLPAFVEALTSILQSV